MTVTLTCKGCAAVITAGDEEELVAEVQAHHAREHNGGHNPSSEHILARLAADDPEEA